jgi:hypothetical protein
MNIDILGLRVFDISGLGKFAHFSLEISRNDFLHYSDLVPHILLGQTAPGDFGF